MRRGEKMSAEQRANLSAKAKQRHAENPDLLPAMGRAFGEKVRGKKRPEVTGPNGGQWRGDLGRSLGSEEQVHHRDGDKTNNALDNLTLFASASEHRLHHLAAHKENA